MFCSLGTQGPKGWGRGVICAAWEHHAKHMEIYFFIVPRPHHYGVKIWGTAGGWLVRSGSQTLLLSNCPCFIYILTFGVIFPCLCVIHLNLVGGREPTLQFSHSFPVSKGWDVPREYGVKESVFLVTRAAGRQALWEIPAKRWRLSFFFRLSTRMAYYWAVTSGCRSRDLTLDDDGNP